MKILKRIGLVILILAGIYLIMAIFCRSHVRVERSIVINADRNAVFDNVNDLTKWKSWSYWDNIDPNMKSTFEGPASGVGAKHSWTSENDSVGHGSLTITKSEPGSLVNFDLAFEDMGTSQGSWTFSDTTGGVKATTAMDMDVPFLGRPIMAFMNMDKMLGSDFEKTLAGLKKLSESAPKAPDVKVELTPVAPMKMLTVADSCTSENISQKLGELYGEIGAVAAKGGAKQAGPVFAIYDKHVVNPDCSMKFWLQAGVPVDKEVKPSGRVKYTDVPARTAIKVQHFGDYNDMKESYDALQAWMAANNRPPTGSPWETYVTDPMVEKDTTKWLTEIYYPVQ